MRREKEEFIRGFLGFGTLAILLVFMGAYIWIEHSHKSSSLLFAQTSQVLEQYSSFDDIETQRVPGALIDVIATTGGGKDVMITLSNGQLYSPDSDQWDRPVFFHVNPDLSYTHIQETSSMFSKENKVSSIVFVILCPLTIIAYFSIPRA